jgi:hypothetical protein
MSLASYETVIDGTKPIEERRAAFASRVKWSSQALDGEKPDTQEMLDRYGDMGLVEARLGPQGGEFPAAIYASDGHQPKPSVAAPDAFARALNNFRFGSKT